MSARLESGQEMPTHVSIIYPTWGHFQQTSAIPRRAHELHYVQCSGINMYFTITAEILARSLANFYRQYADRHMNLKFVRRVSERERAIRPFVIVKNKLMSVFNESVLLLTMNFVITLSK